MKPFLPILAVGLVLPALLAYSSQPNAQASPTATEEPARQPYVVRLSALDEAAAKPLAAAMAKLPGVDDVEAFPGDERKLHILTLEGDYVCQAQVQAIVGVQGLELEAFEIPQWGKQRVYFVEASGGG